MLTAKKPVITSCPPPTLSNKLLRGCWQIVWVLLFRLSPTPLHRWRTLLLRLFGANIGPRLKIYPSCTIWAPWNLKIGERVTVGAANLYNVAEILIDDDAVVSQGAHLCTASHDFDSRDFGLVAAPIHIGNNAWVAADAFIGPGVHIGESAVVAARSVVVRHVTSRDVVAGNPARIVGRRNEAGRNSLR